MATSTSSTTQTGPIEYQLTDQNTDTIYIGANSALNELNIITNTSSNLLGISSYAWANATIPLSVDGKAYSFILNSTSNPNYHSNDDENISFDDGTLYYSAFALSGVNYIAVWLTPSSKQSISMNGNGIYALSQVIVPNISSYANSIQNAASGLVGAAGAIISDTLSDASVGSTVGSAVGSAGGPYGAIVGGVIGGLSALITAGITAQKVKTGVAPTTASQVQEIAQGGYNAYYAKIQAAQATTAKTTTYATSSATSVDMNTVVVLGAILGIGVLGVLALYFMKK